MFTCSQKLRLKDYNMYVPTIKAYTSVVPGEWTDESYSSAQIRKHLITILNIYFLIFLF